VKYDVQSLLACVLALVSSISGAALAPSASSRAPRDAIHVARPRRIISLALPGDEITLALVDSERILALEEFVDDPHASNDVSNARRVAGRIRQPIVAEKILAAEPDFVILPAWSDPQISALLTLQGVPVHRLSAPSSIDDVRSQIRELGAALDEEERAAALIARMDARLEAVRVRGARRATHPRVLLAAWSGITPARGTIFCELAQLAGGRCAADDAGLEGQATLPMEMLWMLDPDLIVKNRFRADGSAREIIAEPRFEDDPRFRALRAVRERHVADIPTAHLLATSHHVASLAEDLCDALDDLSDESSTR
jgi:iron complex transport system substrate-binding protein